MKKFLLLILCFLVAAAMAPEAGSVFLSYADEPETAAETLEAEIPETTQGSGAETDAADPTLAGTSEETTEAEETQPPHEHQYTGKVTKKATCKSKGVMTYICSCGAKYTKPIPLAAHKYKKKVLKKAKCKKAGKARYTCTVCGRKYTKKIPKLGHNYKVKTLRKATCTHKGKLKYKCKRCGKKKIKMVKKKVHHPKVKGKGYVCRDCGVKIKKLSSYQKTLLARDSAVQWAISIAADNDFHYGESSWSHHNGCYFCGTNQSEGNAKFQDGAEPEECEKTYCCNPFVTAAFRHGAGAKEVDCKVSSKRFGLANDRNKVVESPSWKKISKPAKVTSLAPGDVLLAPSHAMLYAGGGKIIHAARHDYGVRDDRWNDSIIYEKISAGKWNSVTKIYRYMGEGKF